LVFGRNHCLLMILKKKLDKPETNEKQANADQNNAQNTNANNNANVETNAKESDKANLLNNEQKDKTNEGDAPK